MGTIKTAAGCLMPCMRVGGVLRETWGLDLATLRWEAMPAFLRTRREHACCAVRGALVVLGGGAIPGGGSSNHSLPPTSRVEMLPEVAGAFVELPQLSCGAIYGATAVAVDEIDSALGQVLLLGGHDQNNICTSSVRLVDLATGVCTPQAALLHARSHFAAAGLSDGRVVCTGGHGILSRVDMWGPPPQGAHDAAWT